MTQANILKDQFQRQLEFRINELDQKSSANDGQLTLIKLELNAITPELSLLTKQFHVSKGRKHKERFDQVYNKYKQLKQKEADIKQDQATIVVQKSSLGPLKEQAAKLTSEMAAATKNSKYIFPELCTLLNDLYKTIVNVAAELKTGLIPIPQEIQQILSKINLEPIVKVEAVDTEEILSDIPEQIAHMLFQRGTDIGWSNYPPQLHEQVLKWTLKVLRTRASRKLETARIKKLVRKWKKKRSNLALCDNIEYIMRLPKHQANHSQMHQVTLEDTFGRK